MKAIALASDNKCIQQLTTVIKSICVHNRHVTFYILNDDIPKEWFAMMRQRLKGFGSEIKDIKCVESELTKFKGPLEHINYVTYFRYIIPDIVKEEKALYLDIDILVRGDLGDLFSLDLEGHLIAAVKESDDTTTFNAGVILFDVERCREKDISHQLITITREKGHEFPLGDQSVLNYLFPTYKELPRCYNWQPGLAYYGYKEYDGDSNPLIVHYSTSHKPWNTHSSSRFRELWWLYYQMDWAEVMAYPLMGSERTASFTTFGEQQFFTLTNSAYIPHLEYLIRSLPDKQFNIAAYTGMAPDLLNLEQYDNVFLYPHVPEWRVEQLLEACSIYLDINAYDEVGSITTRAQKSGKMILAFETTQHGEAGGGDKLSFRRMSQIKW